MKTASNFSVPAKVRVVLGKINAAIAGGAGGGYIFRGEAAFFPLVSSSLYRSFAAICRKDADLRGALPGLTARAMQILLLQNAREYLPGTDEFLLTRLQHLGGHTNRIDFSRDSMVALFFACNKEFGKDGRLLLLPRDFAGVKEARLEGRAVSQRSVFVEVETGVIPLREFTVVRIPAAVKPALLAYLDRHHGISQKTLFADLDGYMDAQVMAQKADLCFLAGQEFHRRGDLPKAIELYGRAVDIKPNYAEAYFQRGVAKMELGKGTDAADIAADFQATLDLEASRVEARVALGDMKASLGRRKEAVKCYRAAIRWELAKESPYMDEVAKIKKEIAKLV